MCPGYLYFAKSANNCLLRNEQRIAFIVFASVVYLNKILKENVRSPPESCPGYKLSLLLLLSHISGADYRIAYFIYLFYMKITCRLHAGYMQQHSQNLTHTIRDLNPKLPIFQDLGLRRANNFTVARSGII